MLCTVQPKNQTKKQTSMSEVSRTNLTANVTDLAEEFIESKNSGCEEEKAGGELIVKSERKIVNLSLAYTVKDLQGRWKIKSCPSSVFHSSLNQLREACQKKKC